MSKTYIYRGLLVLSVMLWAVVIWVNHQSEVKRTPEYLAAAVSSDLQQKADAFHRLAADEQLLDKVYHNRLTADEIQQMGKLPFCFSLFANGNRIFWNNNNRLTTCPGLPYPRGMLSADTGRNISWDICAALPGGEGRTIAASLPIAWIYSIENTYLKSHWEAADMIPATTTISRRPAAGFVPVLLDGKAVFYIHIPVTDMPPGKPSMPLVWALILAVLVSVCFLQVTAMYLGRIFKSGIVYTVLFSLPIIIRLITYFTGLPFHLGELEIFSPQLYATNAFLPSLGDLLINELCISWLLLYVLLEVPFKNFFTGTIAPWLRWLLAFVLVSVLACYNIYIIHLFGSIVKDSNIPFDVGSYNTINVNTFLGLIAVAIIMAISVTLLFFVNALLNNLVRNFYYKNLLLAAGHIFWFVILWHVGRDELSHYGIILISLLFAILMDTEKLRLNSDLFSPRMIFWGIISCIATTLLLQYFNYKKEREQTRIAFAAKLGRQRDPDVLYKFVDIAGSISNDETIRRFLLDPGAAGRSAIDDRIDVLYLNDAISKYQSEIYLYDRNGNGLFNTDTTGLHTLRSRMSTAEYDTGGIKLSFRENAADGHLYLAEVPVRDTDGQTVVGYLLMDLALKRTDNESAYPELLQPGVVQQQNKKNYASAIYYRGSLLLQSGNWSFPVTLQHMLPNGKDEFFTEHTDYSELYYRVDDKTTVVVVYRHNFKSETGTLFSYLFGILMLMNLLVVVFQNGLRVLYKGRFRLPGLTLRTRINYAILGAMLISFLIIGAVTITFLGDQYKSSHKSKLQDIIQVAGNEIDQFLQVHHGLDNEDSFRQVTRSAAFKYLIANIAGRQRIDINIFSADGLLSATSRNEIYDKHLMAPVIRPDAYYQLHNRNLSSYQQQEQIERFSYLSSYMSFHNSNGKVLGFVNIPYFSSEKELHLQISSILVALINLYAFIFIVSGFFAFMIARSVTASLNIIIRQFRNINLRRNERLEWPHNDEIGKLVEEYNKMVKKVEDNAAILVQHEREGAWREMAKQIAHEIKNPLTPMKLNIQYLQNALRNNHPNVAELAAKVSASIIEQIDNLSYIASEFSNFAKMPEAKPEELELNELLERAVTLYHGESSGVAVVFHPCGQHLHVHADKSQLLRVCTNLLQNAVQAIDGKTDGRIDVKLSVSDGQALIAFADNGSGIPEDAQDKIFKPYFTTKTSGTGLGLAMTRKIVELWKGHIWFETEAAAGTTFYIMLPLIGHTGAHE